MKIYQSVLPIVGLAAAVSGSAWAGDLSAALNTSKPIFESSLRLENVDQQGFAEEAQALTWRNRVGVETGTFHNWSALFELDATAAPIEDYNSTLNGKTSYPGVPDPEVVELNRAQLKWVPDKTTALTLGRQRIVLDDGRFVGNSGWRQDEQTFDGVRFDKTLGKFAVTGAYLSRVNRVIGNEKDWNSNSYLINASYTFAPEARLTGFVYALKFSSDAETPTVTDRANARASSVSIAGARLSGSRKTGDLTFGYVAQYAQEGDAGNNPQDFELEEMIFEASAAYKIFTAKVNFEKLGGNGTVGFVAPIATAHPFQGFADAFSATGGNKTYVNGINDLTLSLGINLPGRFKPAITVFYHDFSTARLDQKLGKELDIVATAALTPKLNLMLKYADFDRDNPLAPASRSKTWVMLQYKL